MTAVYDFTLDRRVPDLEILLLVGVSEVHGVLRGRHVGLVGQLVRVDGSSRIQSQRDCHHTVVVELAKPFISRRGKNGVGMYINHGFFSFDLPTSILEQPS